MHEPPREPWIELHDAEFTSQALVARVEERLQRTRAQLGPLSRRFPTFQPQFDPAPGTTPGAPAANIDYANESAGARAEHAAALRRLQELPLPATHAALAVSPATRLPLLGCLWALVRSQAHQLVLFYVNRHIAHQAQHNRHAAHVLHELSATLQAQQQEIARLQARLAALEEEDGSGDG